ncbi:hypothetical protein SISSUDRAFT_779985 [Sistotremastrum suecicum HHB10207 ss-3]|uniref:Secreted protein n=1 Tax=Sistotremastrum suecicum HHB10207 ss-3 TaxID=1314776 RepID=A0A166D3T0_9AGAM|nr:hypothetical protein SISSUDRAFT_779985 [Sistotremastrum suecicum HHB10207 ss-3]
MKLYRGVSFASILIVVSICQVPRKAEVLFTEELRAAFPNILARLYRNAAMMTSSIRCFPGQFCLGWIHVPLITSSIPRGPLLNSTQRFLAGPNTYSLIHPTIITTP